MAKNPCWEQGKIDKRVIALRMTHGWQLVISKLTFLGGTFLLTLVYGFAYLKEKNLWVLGIIHAWLGAIFFYTVLNRDPWVEVFERMAG